MQYISLNTTLCYIRRADETLMLHRNKKVNDRLWGKWVVPGGHFEPGESPEECARREVKRRNRTRSA